MQAAEEMANRRSSVVRDPSPNRFTSPGRGIESQPYVGPSSFGTAPRLPMPEPKPGPGLAYNEHREEPIAGGRINPSERRFVTDEDVRQRSWQPPPGSYDPDVSSFKSKSFNRFVQQSLVSTQKHAVMLGREGNLGLHKSRRSKKKAAEEERQKQKKKKRPAAPDAPFWERLYKKADVPATPWEPPPSARSNVSYGSFHSRHSVTFRGEEKRNRTPVSRYRSTDPVELGLEKRSRSPLGSRNPSRVNSNPSSARGDILAIPIPAESTASAASRPVPADDRPPWDETFTRRARAPSPVTPRPSMAMASARRPSSASISSQSRSRTPQGGRSPSPLRQNGFPLPLSPQPPSQRSALMHQSFGSVQGMPGFDASAGTGDHYSMSSFDGTGAATGSSLALRSMPPLALPPPGQFHHSSSSYNGGANEHYSAGSSRVPSVRRPTPIDSPAEARRAPTPRRDRDFMVMDAPATYDDLVPPSVTDAGLLLDDVEDFHDARYRPVFRPSSRNSQRR